MKKNGKSKLGGSLNMKLKKKLATKARKGVNPFTKEPCVFKAKPASKTVRAFTDLDKEMTEAESHKDENKEYTEALGGIAGTDVAAIFG